MRLVTYLLAAAILWAVATSGPASSNEAPGGTPGDASPGARTGSTHGK